MNNIKSGNYGKLIAFLFIAVIFLCVFGFAAEGWQAETPNEPDSGEVVAGKDDGADENKDGNTTEDAEPEVYVPKHTNPLTGIECDAKTEQTHHTAFVLDTGAPLYGASYADVAIEFPVEDGGTRLVAFVSDVNALGKVGSLAPTRGYISNLTNPFGAVLVALGCDDKITYVHTDLSAAFLDLSKSTGYHYTEYTHFNYSNGHLINAGLANSGLGATSEATLPYLFTDYGATEVRGGTACSGVLIPYSAGSQTELKYSASDRTYSYSKNGICKTDMLTDKSIDFDNVFILFADAVTYETATATQMILNTQTEGFGYYLTGGTSSYITWASDENGGYVFYNESGEPLTVNRGTSYISFVKSSMSTDVKFY